jgi:hypothetical protein
MVYSMASVEQQMGGKQLASEIRNAGGGGARVKCWFIFTIPFVSTTKS